MHVIRVEAPGMLKFFGSFHGLVNKVMFERGIEFVVDFVDFFGFMEFFDMFIKLKELGHVSFLKEFLVVFHHSFHMVFNFLQLFGGKRRLYLINEGFLEHHAVINDSHLINEPLLFSL